MKSGIKNKITDFHYNNSTPALSILYTVLFLIPSFFYFIVINIKNFLYKIGFFKEYNPEIFTICVGNLTTGGVGKTPVVMEIANYYASLGKKTVILTRGYKGNLNKKAPVLVRDYNKILINDPIVTGDEVNLISKNIKNSAVVVSKDRKKGAEFAKNKLNADILILDDGFSNRKIYKNLNIILIDSEKMFGNNFVLPMGPLREPLSELKRAQKILVINKNDKKNKNLDKFLSALKIPYQICKMETGEIYNIKTNKILEKNENILAFTGIGQPDQFYQKLKNLKKSISFDDHFEYNQKIIDNINLEAEKLNIKTIVTTEKDAVKLLNFKNTDNFYALKLEPKLDLKNLLE